MGRSKSTRDPQTPDVTATDIEDLLAASGGLLVRRAHPELAHSIDRQVRSGRLRAVLPGVYALPELSRDPSVRVRAASLRLPDAVVLTGAAARALFWPSAPMPSIEIATPGPVPPVAGFSFNRRRIPPELVVELAGVRYSSPALTAIDLATFSCADAIDIALRERRATLDGMYEALRLTPNRTGNPARRRLLVDSRAQPWSAAERRAHRLLRQARIDGWTANLPVVVLGRLYYIDIAFARAKLAVEIDGRLHETDEDLFQSDRWRQNALVAAGWTVLRFTWEMLTDHPETFLEAVRGGLR